MVSVNVIDENGMILAIDVYYIENRAKAVGILFNSWGSCNVDAVINCYLDNVEPYQSGAFYKRELPCILLLLQKIDLTTIHTIIVDGYVMLGEGKKGLGAHLDEALNHTIPIVGIAKNEFTNQNDDVIAVYRGKSKHPLYVTSTESNLDKLADDIKSMHGTNRMPTLLKYLDTQTKLFKEEI